MAAVTMRLYFAYGSNMDKAQMRRRCPGGRPYGTAILPGYQFSIGQHGYATVIPDSQTRVYGLLWHLSARNERALDRYEAVQDGLYDKAQVDVELLPGPGTLPSWLYIDTKAVPGFPQPGYVERILEAARHLQFPASYQTELRQWIVSPKLSP